MEDHRPRPDEFPKNHLKMVYVEIFPANYCPPEDVEAYYVLSTGRCGTKTLDNLLCLSPDVASFHEPMPRLHRYHAQMLHEPLINPDFNATPRLRHPNNIGLFNNLLLECRIDLVSVVMQMGHKYAECQHRWTPYAPHVKNVFPKTKFIYLRRDMDAFVSSAIQYRWYDMEKETYAPPECQDDEGKLLAWFWCKTNELIIRFLKTLAPDEWIFLDFDDIKYHSWEKFIDIFEFMGAESPSDIQIESALVLEYNKGKRGKIKKGWGDFDERAREIYKAIG